MRGKGERNADQRRAFIASRTAKLTVTLNGNESHHHENDHVFLKRNERRDEQFPL
jgi:hypothetical protein